MELQLIYVVEGTNSLLAQSAGSAVIEYTDCISAEGQDSPDQFPGMTLKMSWWGSSNAGDLGEYGVLFHCHRSQVHSGSVW